MIKRTTWTTDFRRGEYGGASLARDDVDPNLISSLTEDGLHAPVIDLDFECELVPSSSPGHYHLYIDKEISWKAYYKILTALYEAGLIDAGWYKEAAHCQQSFVRRKGIYKPFDDLKESIEKNGLFPEQAEPT